VSNLLGLSEAYDEHTNLDLFWEDIEEYPPSPKLSDRIISLFHNAFPDINLDLVQESYTRAISRREEPVLKQLFMVRKLLGEQLRYFDMKFVQKIRVYFVHATIDRNYYGGMFAFWNSDRKETLFIQGITKSLIFTLHSLFAPKTTPFSNLNSLLQPSIEELARTLKSNRILVAPIGKQGDILTRYYGYTLTRDIYFPSNKILGRENILHNPGLYPVYEKIL
jgi:hypothetical protein